MKLPESIKWSQNSKNLKIKKVLIVSGNSDESPWVKNELGKACVTCIKESLQGKNIIAVTGGSTMAAVAEMMTPQLQNMNCFLYQHEAELEKNVQNQANTICSIMAEQTGSKHRVLYVPDQVSKEIYQSLIKEPEIHEVLYLIKSANMVLHGIGDAITMANGEKQHLKIYQKLRTR